MNAALLVLFGLQSWAKLRRVARGLRTPRGAIFSLVGLAIMTFWIGPSLWLAGTWRAPDPELVASFASSIILLVMCMMVLLPFGGHGAAYFTPAEINFLFPGPFSRRALLTYKLGSAVPGLGLTALLVTVAELPFLPWWVSACVGIFLTMLFFQLFGMVVALLIQMIGERAYTRARRVALFGLVLVLVAGLWKALAAVGSEGLLGLIHLFRIAGPGSTLLTPPDFFARAIGAQSLQELALWGGLALGVDVAMLGLVFWLDARCEEATLMASQRAFDRLEQMRRGGGLWALTRIGRARWRPPMPSWLGGAGPLAWRQLTAAVRQPWTLIGMMIFALIPLAPSLMAGRSAPGVPAFVLMLGPLFSMWLQCDFRGDLDHLPWLKLLPLRPAAVAAGELAAPAILTTLVQLMALATIVLVVHDPWVPLITAAFLPPLNMLLFGAQNLVFLLFPARMAPATAGDFQHFARLAVLWVLQLMALLMCGGVAALVALVAAWLAGWSWTMGLATSWGAIVLEAGGFIPLLAWAYNRFDVSLHTPP